MQSSYHGPVHILAIAPFESMAVSLQRSAESFPDAVLDAFTGDLQEGAEVLRSQDLSSYDAILSRGGTADLIREMTDLPVVEIPVLIADVLRTIKLAESYTDRMAVVGFPGVTASAHTLCNLLRMKIPIETVRSSEELPEVLDRLRKMQIGTVICDAVTHRTAKAAGFQALLITSGEQSLQQAIQSALLQGRKFRALRNENTLLRSMLQQNLEQCVVLDSDKDVVFASEGRHSEELIAAMRRRISAIPGNRELLFYHQEGTMLHTITASRFHLQEKQLYLFRDQPARISLRSAQSGIRFYDEAECEQLLSGSFFTLSGSEGELQTRLKEFSKQKEPVMILGEEGTGREQAARAMYLQSEWKNHPFVVVDGARINDRSWSYLTEHDDSPLGTLGTTVLFHHLEELSPQRQHTLLSLIEESNLAKRLWLLFACEVLDGRAVHAFTREISARLNPLSVQLPALRNRRDEIPALASIYLSNLNMELGKQISGFEPGTLDMLVRYDWPGNYAQFKRVLHELAVMTEGHYISGTDTAELLAGERKFYYRQSDEIGSLFAGGMTLDEMTRKIIGHSLAENNGNQSLTARRLGISRSTLWRILSGKEQQKE